MVLRRTNKDICTLKSPFKDIRTIKERGGPLSFNVDLFSGNSGKRQEPIYAKVKKGIRFADDVEDEGHGKETVTTTTTTTKTVTVQKEKRTKSKEGKSKSEMTNGGGSNSGMEHWSCEMSNGR